MRGRIELLARKAAARRRTKSSACRSWRAASLTKCSSRVGVRRAPAGHPPARRRAIHWSIGSAARPVTTRPRGRRSARRGSHSRPRVRAAMASANHGAQRACRRAAEARACAAAPTTRRAGGPSSSAPIVTSLETPAGPARRWPRDRGVRTARCDRPCRDDGAKRGAARSSRSAPGVHDRLPRPGRAGLQRVLQHRVGLVRADLHDGPQRLALHLRVGVVEQLDRCGQGVAAQPAKQLDGGPAHRGVARRAQLLAIRSRAAPPNDISMSRSRRIVRALSSPSIASMRRLDDGRPQGQTEARGAGRSVSSPVACRAHVGHPSPEASCASPDFDIRDERRGLVPGRRSSVSSNSCARRQVADEHELVDARERQVVDLAPGVGPRSTTSRSPAPVGRAAQLLVADRRDPGGDAVRRVVADAFDLDGGGPRRRQLAGVVVRHELRRPSRTSASPTAWSTSSSKCGSLPSGCAATFSASGEHVRDVVRRAPARGTLWPAGPAPAIRATFSATKPATAVSSVSRARSSPPRSMPVAVPPRPAAVAR